MATDSIHMIPPRARTGSASKAIFWGGLICGILDLTSAIVAWGLRGAKPLRVLQSVASGLLGPAAFQGGWPTGVLGLGLHFLIAFTAAAVYYMVSRKLTFLVTRPIICGLLYGEIVFLFMNFVVLPLSAVHKSPFALSWPYLISGPLGHLFFVGLPISLAVRRYSK